MPTSYFVILDNTMIDEPLAPGLPYWSFPTASLPTAATAERFIEDVLYQSELWANAASGDEWISLRLIECRKMCPRCGHLLARLVGDDEATIHIVWYVARNPQPDIMTHEASMHLGGWHQEYLEHHCQVNLLG